jgi:serine/threonine protein kinase
VNFSNGTELGGYEIVSSLGAGGMGEVYRARDRKLKRDVAIKVLPYEFAHDPDRVSRFQREAEALAALNHSNIASIYDVQEINSTRFLVLELVDGETLSEKLRRGALSIDESLSIAKQICEALEAAHEKGILHRDLKPANIKVTPEGKVKLLDFGLARLFETEAGDAEISNSPTLVSRTGAGMIIGTASYMSPEQARGQKAGKQADIWSFGCVLYEMLTGRLSFAGETVTDILAGIVKVDPDWSPLPQSTPWPIRSLLRHCLRKDPKRRLQSITDAALAIEEAQLTPAASAAEANAGRRRSLVPILSVGIIVVLIAALAIVVMQSRKAPVQPVETRFPLSIPPNLSLLSGRSDTAIALSPDGRRLAYVARAGSTTQIYSRSMDSLDAVPIHGTEGASGPFFSADGEWIGFYSHGKLKKVPVAGGEALSLLDPAFDRGSTWLPDDSIVFGGADSGLWQVSASGGAPKKLLIPDGQSEVNYSWPHALPGGKAIVFAMRRKEGSTAIGALRVDTRERVVLVEAGTKPMYISSGHLVFIRGRDVLAVAFDEGTLKVQSTPVPVIKDVMISNPELGTVQLTSSEVGSIAYVPGGEAQENRRLVWVDRRGAVEPVQAPKRNYEFPRLSPDGQQVAMGINGGSDPGYAIWLYQFARRTLSRFTPSVNEPETPAWTPDGMRLAYARVSTVPGTRRQILWKATDGSTSEEILAAMDGPHLHLGGWSRQGDSLIATATDTGALWILEMADKRTVRPLLETSYAATAGTLSPDGRWFAYASNDTNRSEVYVQGFRNTAGKYQISIDGGTEPVWAKDGSQLFYRNEDKMMAVRITPKRDGLDAGTPTMLFEGRFAVSNVSGGDAWYDVSPDGQRFLMLKIEDPPNSGILVVQNWTEELQRLVPKN